MINEIPPRSGTAFTMDKGQRLTVIDPEGMQVADLLAFKRADIGEVISAGRTFDYAETIYLTTGHQLFSNRSNPLLEIVEDMVGRHDFLLTPCSKDTFRICYDDHDPHRGCFGNLAEALAPFGVNEDMIPSAFNCFMNVPVDGETGRFKVLPPISKAGDRIVFEAKEDVVIGLTACSARDSNGGSFKPIHWTVD
nr:urea carboxylase-associated family protein [Sphingomonas sabuli]